VYNKNKGYAIDPLTGSLVVGGVKSLLGWSSSNKASKVQAEANKIDRENLDFQREQYATHQSIYGSNQEDLRDYIKNNTGYEIASKHIEEITKATQLANQKLKADLAKRGLSNSGIEMDMLNQNNFKSGLIKSEQLAKADQVHYKQMMDFSALGMGEGTAMLGNISNSSVASSSHLSSYASNLYSGGANLFTSGTNDLQDISGVLYGQKVMNNLRTNKPSYNNTDDGSMY